MPSYTLSKRVSGTRFISITSLLFIFLFQHSVINNTAEWFAVISVVAIVIDHSSCCAFLLLLCSVCANCSTLCGVPCFFCKQIRIHSPELGCESARVPYRTLPRQFVVILNLSFVWYLWWMNGGPDFYLFVWGVSFMVYRKHLALLRKGRGVRKYYGNTLQCKGELKNYASSQSGFFFYAIENFVFSFK